MVYTVVDLFSGCGGISKGFELEGFDIIGGIDNDEDATKTFGKNFANAKVFCEDISLIKDEEIPYLFNLLGEVDVLVGGPPCQGFSNANRWLTEVDPRNKLFYEYIRFVKALKPKYVLIENVRGILTKDNGYAKEKIHSILSAAGYNVNSKILDASAYGVPQKRFRAFFLASREDMPVLDLENLETKVPVTVHDAINELYPLEYKEVDEETQNGVYRLKTKPSNDFQRYLRSPDNIITSHIIKYPSDIQQERISHVPQGGNWKDIPSDLFPNNRSNRHSSAFKRLKEDDFSVTIDTGNAHSNYFHSIYHRIPTVREAARLQSFPDSFIFEGTRTSQYRQVGNAVPPLLSRAVSKRIKEGLDFHE